MRWLQPSPPPSMRQSGGMHLSTIARMDALFMPSISAKGW
jgi:hypothetical protein